jgi:hypothetical protein
MFLFIEPPVNQFSTVDAVRAWQHTLTALRTRYCIDGEALACIVRAEQHAERLLEEAMWMQARASLRAS